MSTGKPCLYLSAREPRGPVFSRFPLKTNKTKTCNLINVDNINKHGKLKWDNHLLSTTGKKAWLMLPSQLLEGQILITEHANISSCREGRDQWGWEIRKKKGKLRAELKFLPEFGRKIKQALSWKEDKKTQKVKGFTVNLFIWNVASSMISRCASV